MRETRKRRAHSIWELTLHIAGWMDEVAERLDGRYHSDPEMGNFPSPEQATEEHWTKAQQTLDAASRKLFEAIQRFPEERLLDRVITPEGPSLTYFDTLVGAAEHNTYHAGQIALLRKSIR